MRRGSRPLLTLASLLPCWGCSFIFVRGPPAPAAATKQEAQCTREAVAPSVDAAAALILGSIGVAAVATRNDAGCPGPECYFNGAAVVRGAGLLFLGAAAVSAASSIYGYLKVDRCQTWTEAREACWRGDAAACAQFVPVNRPSSAAAGARVDPASFPRPEAAELDRVDRFPPQ